jgi:AcrR family transcriptional regulator
MFGTARQGVMSSRVELVALTYEPAAPVVRRPTRADAVDLARASFLSGDRLDMQTLATSLGISRTTLYSWVGARENLIAIVLGELTDLAWSAVAQQAEGDGSDRALDAARRFMEVTANFAPLRRFAEREPQVALRVLLSPDGIVAQRIRAGVTRVISENSPDAEEISPELIDIAVQVGTALEWAPIAIGGQPEIERATRLIRSLFDTDRAARRIG